jgi:hypothetical protein
MRMIINLVLLVGGFLGGIYFGRAHPEEAAKIDDKRSQVQAEYAPQVQAQIQAAVAKAKIELLQRLQTPSGGSAPIGGSGYVASGGGPSVVSQSALAEEMKKAVDEQNKAQAALNAK